MRTLICSLAALLAAGPVMAQEQVPPVSVRIMHGDSTAAEVAAEIAAHVRRAISHTNRYKSIWQAGDSIRETDEGDWNVSWCTISDVTVEVGRPESARSPLLAVVMGRTRVDVVRGLPSRAVAEAHRRVHRPGTISGGRFRLMFVHETAGWRLRHAFFKPEINAEPELLKGLPPIGWQPVWDGASETDDRDFCMVRAHWSVVERTSGRRA